jgi:hypothetical protein
VAKPTTLLELKSCRLQNSKNAVRWNQFIINNDDGDQVGVLLVASSGLSSYTSKIIKSNIQCAEPLRGGLPLGGAAWEEGV